MGPLFKLVLRNHAIEGLGARGYGRREIARAMRGLDDDLIETCFVLSGVSVASLPPGALEERPILDAIAGFLRGIGEWFKTPEGQAFLKMLFQLLIGLIGGLSIASLVAVIVAINSAVTTDSEVSVLHTAEDLAKAWLG